MTFAPDISLPTNANYIIIGEFDKEYNAHWDITWSFTYALTGNEHGICTYLTDSIPVSSTPGHYMGYINQYGNPNGFLAIALDTTGFFAVSSNTAEGINQNNVLRKSIIVRNNEKLIYNQPLSALNTDFLFTETNYNPKTLRFRVANGLKKLYVDFKDDKKYINLLQIPLSGYDPDDYLKIYPVISYTSPVSSQIASNSKFWLSNFHVQGVEDAPTYEFCDFVALSTQQISVYNYINIHKK